MCLKRIIVDKVVEIVRYGERRIVDKGVKIVRYGERSQRNCGAKETAKPNGSLPVNVHKLFGFRNMFELNGNCLKVRHNR